MSELTEIIRLIEGVRDDSREDSKELKDGLRELTREIRIQNGRVTKNEARIKRIERERDEAGEAKKTRRNWKYDLAAGTLLVTISYLLATLQPLH